MTTSTNGLYLFAVGRHLDPSVLSGVEGIGGAALAIVDCQDLQAVVCAVDLHEFGEASLARNLEDLTWLERVARTHNDVVFAVAETGTVAPMRLVTICEGERSVRDRIDALHQELSSALDRVEGRREWSVKVYAATAEAERSPEPADDAVEVGSGAAYLRRKRAAADRRRAASDRSLHVADEIFAELAAVAVASRQLPPQDPRLTGRTEPMILNAAYLISLEEGAAFRALVQRVGDSHPGASLEAEGPWPPYSFATLDAP